MSSRATELKKSYRPSSDSKPMSVLSELCEVVGGKRVVREGEGKQRSEKGVKSLDF